MNSLIINFDDNADMNSAYIQLKKLYPKNKIAKANINYEELEDEYLLAIAEERIKNDTGVRYSHEDIMRIHGITQEELDAMEDVELEIVTAARSDEEVYDIASKEQRKDKKFLCVLEKPIYFCRSLLKLLN
ncbi:MAG: hypothetical protein FWF92_08345 [Oscillospiraceae bacterium]|nr:hypothetical protein [Oscillospiraceae bacterium]